MSTATRRLPAAAGIGFEPRIPHHVRIQHGCSEVPDGDHQNQKACGNEAAYGSASTDPAPVFRRIPLLKLPRSVFSRGRVRIYTMRYVPRFLELPGFGAAPQVIEAHHGPLVVREVGGARGAGLFLFCCPWGA